MVYQSPPPCSELSLWAGTGEHPCPNDGIELSWGNRAGSGGLNWAWVMKGSCNKTGGGGMEPCREAQHEPCDPNTAKQSQRRGQ